MGSFRKCFSVVSQLSPTGEKQTVFLLKKGLNLRSIENQYLVSEEL